MEVLLLIFIFVILIAIFVILVALLSRLDGTPKEFMINELTYGCRPHFKKYINVVFKGVSIYTIFIVKLAYLIPTFEFLWKAKQNNCKESKNDR